MEELHYKLLRNLLAVIVCLCVAITPVYGEIKTILTSSDIGVSGTVEADQSVPYQYVEMNEEGGYLWKPDVPEGWTPEQGGEFTGNYWIPIGLWGSVSGKTSNNIKTEFGQLEGSVANSVAVEVLWSEFSEPKSYGYGKEAWDKYDILLSELKDKGKKAFVVIKLDPLPGWIEEYGNCFSYYSSGPEINPETGKLVTIHTEPWKSNLKSYTDSDAIEQVNRFVEELVARYAIGGSRQDLASVVAGWILDIGEGFVDRNYKTYIGYEESGVTDFKDWLSGCGDYSGEAKYLNVGELNTKWGTNYIDFNEVEMPVPFDEAGNFVARDSPGWYDLLKWRKQVIAKWIKGIIGVIIDAEKVYTEGDIIHLISVLTPGSEPGDSDWLYSSIDMNKISSECKDLLNFWSISCMPSFTEDDEGISTQWQLVRTRAMTELPVLVLQLKYEKNPEIENRQKSILQTNIWELLFGGVLGVQLFDGEDEINVEGMSMEILNEICSDMAKLQQIKITNELNEVVYTKDFIGYLVSSETPSPEIGFLQTDAQETIFNRLEAEIYSLYGPLKRLGFQPGFIRVNEEGYIYSGDLCADYMAIVLARNQKMKNNTLDDLVAISSNIKLFANADLPGIMDEYGSSRVGDTDWVNYMDLLFGIDVSGVNIEPEYESPPDNLVRIAKGIYTNSDEVLDFSYSGNINMWKYRDENISTNGHILEYFNKDGEDTPALVMNNNYNGCISLFSMGDSNGTGVGNWGWGERYKFMELIFKNKDAGFNLGDEMVMSVSGSPYIWVDCRKGPENSIIVYLCNYSSLETQSVELKSNLLINRKIESMLTGKLINEYNEVDTVQVNGLEPQGQDILLVTLASPPNQPPVASFTASATSVYTNDSITFDASASSDDDGVIQSYAWDFGDGTNGSGAVVTHKYSSAGYYKVTLTVTDDDGAISTSTPVITITVAEFQNNAPVSSFTVSKISPSIGEEIIFNASGSYDDGNIVSYIWNFGDGASANGVIVTHKYDNPGSYIVKLTVTDNYGASSSASPITVLVLESPNQAPIASFTVSKTSPSIGEEVTFDASKSYDGDGTIQSYSWDFGDGTSGTGAIVTHKYDKAGSYTVELTVTDNRGGNGTTNLTITVSESKVGTVKDESITGGSSQGTGSQSQPSSLSSNLTTSTQGAQTGSNTTTQTQGAFPGSYGVVILDESSVAGTSADKGSKSSASSSSSATSAKSSANESYKRTTVGNSSGGIGGKERTGGIFRSESREMPPLVEPSLIEELPQQYSYTESEPLLGTRGPSITRTGVDSVIQGFRPKNIITTTISEPVTKPADVSFNENIFLRLIINSMQQFINFLNKLGSRGVKLFSRKSIWRNTDKFTA